MPICKKCNKHFPNQKKIDDKIRILNKRKYCLDCSPFNKNNTSKLHEMGDEEYQKHINFINITETSDKEIRNITCQCCNRIYRYDKKNRKGHSLKICNSCHVNLRRFKLKDDMLEYKGGKCQTCGYNKCKGALEFHHIDSNKKIFTVSGRHSYGWEKIKKELDKCILLCSNCHRELESNAKLEK